jgi:UDP-glucose 4-epimerase
VRVLVTGGAGYIGSVTAARLLQQGHQVVVLDDLSRGHRQAVPRGARFVQGDVTDRQAVGRLLREEPIDCIMHFAARSLVGESMEDPVGYFGANLRGLLALLEAAQEAGVRHFVLSSTAAVYGEPREVPIPEEAPVAPTNPYGHSKAMCEEILRWQARLGRIRFVSLRYFNAAGATEDLGEDHDPETHLIPIALQVALGKRRELVIFGDSYPTPDGTCVRDYIHVEDLADAHILALGVLGEREETILNLGNGQGFSVREVVETARRVTGHPIPARVGPPRPGDPPVLVASSRRAREVLGWEPRKPSLESIVASAWEWMRRHPEGYRDASTPGG